MLLLLIKLMISCTSLSKFDIIICYCFFRCKDEHIKREERFQNPETEERLLGFAMFEAELFCHYRVRSLIFFPFLCVGDDAVNVECSRLNDPGIHRQS